MSGAVAEQEVKTETGKGAEVTETPNAGAGAGGESPGAEKGKTAPEPGAGEGGGQDPKWLPKRLKQAERATQERIAKDMGFDSYEAMQKARPRKTGKDGEREGSDRNGARRGDAQREKTDDSSADAGEQQTVQGLRQRVKNLERMLASEQAARSTDAGLFTIQMSALRAGITNDAALRIATVMFTDEMDKDEAKYAGMDAAKLSAAAGEFFKVLRDQHGGLFDSIGQKTGLTTGPPAGSRPDPAPPNPTATDDTQLSKKDFEAKARSLEGGPPQ